MELKQIFFEKRTRISGSAQRLSGYAFLALFVILGIVFLIIPFVEKFQIVYIAVGIAMFGPAYLAYRSALKFKRVEADETKVYIQQSKGIFDEILYSQFTNGRRARTLLTSEFYIKLYFTNDDGREEVVRFMPRILGDHYDNFVELLVQKNPNMNVGRRRR